MSFLKLLENTGRAVGHGVAVGATTIAEQVAPNDQNVRRAREDQQRRLQDAARGVGSHGQTVGTDLGRVVGTTGASLGVLGQIVTDPGQLKRLVELLGTYDLKGFVEALLHRRGRLQPNFFPAWIRRAGGYFPKLAQVLSVRSDLIKSREVLEQLSQCLENMPAKDEEAVRQHLARENVPFESVAAALNAGTVAQVNPLRLSDGTSAVVKIAWPDTRRQMSTDFRIFEHARAILGALKLEHREAQAVGAIFSAVGKSEAAVLREFDMRIEARSLETAGRLCHPGGPWEVAYAHWLTQAQSALAGAPPAIQALGLVLALEAQTQGFHVRVPQPLPGMVRESVLVMSCAGGESMHKLLTGGVGDAGTQEAAKVVLGSALPLIGWLLLCRSTSDLAHVDPHPGNFRWDTTTRTLWVLDWGSNVNISDEKRMSLCLVVQLIANADGNGGNDRAIADAAESFGVRAKSPQMLASLMHGLFNASRTHTARDAIHAAAVDEMLHDVDEAIVPVVRCLATVGGMLKEIQRRVHDETNQNVRLSLAALWAPFAEMGLTQ